ncbi:ClpP/crotonase-like domain-containing protein [Phlyctochytrium arcticum]|nr:ClpP/crotonase-like domain-containing protein [Phlyctochytrium arcticum]
MARSTTAPLKAGSAMQATQRIAKISESLSAHQTPGSTAQMATAAASGGNVDVRHQKMQSVRMFLLNRPKAFNALTKSMVNNITPQLQVWADSNTCKVIVLSAVDGKAFCAGGDVKKVVQQATSGEPEQIAQALKFFEEEYQLNHLIGTLKKPFISVMNGITMGGGVGLSVHAPFRIATEKTLFAMPETEIGLFPDVGGSFFLPRLDGEVGTYLGLSGARLKGHEVFQAGIATHYIPSERLPALMARLAELESDEIEVINGVLEEFVENIEASEWRNWKLGGEVGNAIDRCFKYNNLEEIIAALEKEKSPWAEKTLETMKTFSPLSLKVTLEQLRKGRTLGFAECFRMEYNMVQEFLHTPDFIEGVTAKLMEKREPKWNPTWENMGQVTPEVIKTYFEPVKQGSGKQSASSLPSRTLNFLNGLTYHDYPHRPLSGLPTTEDIQRVVNGQGRRGREQKHLQSKQEVLTYFEQNWGAYDSGIVGIERGLPPLQITIEGGFGRGKAGLREKVLSVLDRYTKEGSNSSDWSRLQWTGPASRF